MSVKKLSFYIDTAKITVKQPSTPKEIFGKEHTEFQSEQFGS